MHSKALSHSLSHDDLSLHRLQVMANMLEGGVTPTDFSLEELSVMGYRLVSYPLSLLATSIAAMESALVGLKRGKGRYPFV